MTNRETIRALIDEGYEARSTGDIERIMLIFHPQGKFQLAGSQEFTTVAGTARGHQELRATLAKLIANFEFIKRDLISTVIDGEHAAVHSRVQLRFVPKETAATTDILDLWKFENGKVVELIEFVDTAMVNELMR